MSPSVLILVISLISLNLTICTHQLSSSEDLEILNQGSDDGDDLHCDNAEYCDSIVTRCYHTKRCKCNWKTDAKCSKECFICLEEKFAKCCECVGLCRGSTDSNYAHSSHVANLSKTESDDGLFKILTREPDVHGRWRSLEISASRIVKHPIHGRLEWAYRGDSNSIELSNDETLEKMSCTVAFINRQLGLSKCKKYCVSMGATSYRWFYDGCCECVGRHCLDFGLDEPKCIIKYD